MTFGGENKEEGYELPPAYEVATSGSNPVNDLSAKIAGSSSVSRALTTLKDGCYQYVKESIDVAAKTLGLSKHDTNVVEEFAEMTFTEPFDTNNKDVNKLGASVRAMFERAAAAIKKSWGNDHGRTLNTIKSAVTTLFTGIAKFVKAVGKGLAIGALAIPHMTLVRPAKAIARGAMAAARKVASLKKGTTGRTA